MSEVNLCPECGVPEPFYQRQLWLNNGDIVQTSNHQTRMGFIECEAIDPLFENIGKIIGVPILPLVTNITARGTRLYLDHLIPQQVKDMVQARTLGLEPFIDSITTFRQIIGYGKYEFMDYRFENDEDDYSRMRIWKPFSVAEAAGAFAGAVSAVVGGEHAVTHEEVSPRLYELVSRWTAPGGVKRETADARVSP